MVSSDDLAVHFRLVLLSELSLVTVVELKVTLLDETVSRLNTDRLLENLQLV